MQPQVIFQIIAWTKVLRHHVRAVDAEGAIWRKLVDPQWSGHNASRRVWISNLEGNARHSVRWTPDQLKNSIGCCWLIKPFQKAQWSCHGPRLNDLQRTSHRDTISWTNYAWFQWLQHVIWIHIGCYWRSGQHFVVASTESLWWNQPTIHRRGANGWKHLIIIMVTFAHQMMVWCSFLLHLMNFAIIFQFTQQKLDFV